MSTKSKTKIPEISFELSFRFQMKNYNLAFNVNPKVVLSILLPIVVKGVQMILQHYGVSAP